MVSAFAQAGLSDGENLDAVLPRAVKIKVTTNDAATPTLNDVLGALKVGSKQHLVLQKRIAGRLETLTKNHIRKAALTRHKTASRLGANPTNYLAKKAETVETEVKGNGLLWLTVYGDIFRRVDGAVEVVARRKKWLTIPGHAEAYGRRARELDGLTFIKLKGDKAALLKLPVEGGKKIFPKTKEEWKAAVRYWLKKGVTLPQDRGLLPTEDDYLKAMDEGAEDYLDLMEQKGSGFIP